MTFDLKVRQSYHGNGGKEGYRYKLYNNKGKKLGELKDFPINYKVNSVVELFGEYYIISHYYDSTNPRDERSEVIFYELVKYEFKPDFVLEMV